MAKDHVNGSDPRHAPRALAGGWVACPPATPSASRRGLNSPGGNGKGMRCDTCGNDYDKAFQVTTHDQTTYAFDGTVSNSR